MRYFLTTNPGVIILSKAEGDIAVNASHGIVSIQKLTRMTITAFVEGEKCRVDFTIEKETRTFYAHKEVTKEIYDQILNEQGSQTKLVSHVSISNDDTITRIL